VHCEHESRLGIDKATDIIPKTKRTSQKTLRNPKNRLRLAIIADIILCNKARVFTSNGTEKNMRGKTENLRQTDVETCLET
jgi:hypothetical protein